MEPISEDVIQEFKELYVRESGLGVESNESFDDLLQNAYSYVVDKSDQFNINTDKTGKQLVFDRARFVRANASELFYKRFLPDLNAFSLKLAMESDYDDS